MSEGKAGDWQNNKNWRRVAAFEWVSAWKRLDLDGLTLNIILF